MVTTDQERMRRQAWKTGQQVYHLRCQQQMQT